MLKYKSGNAKDVMSGYVFNAYRVQLKVFERKR